MSWREMMKKKPVKNISRPIRNIRIIRNIKKSNPSDGGFADIAHENQKAKTPQQKYDILWKKAWALADWIDDPDSKVPWQERAARVPELQKMSMMIGELELLIN